MISGMPIFSSKGQSSRSQDVKPAASYLLTGGSGAAPADQADSILHRNTNIRWNLENMKYIKIYKWSGDFEYHTAKTFTGFFRFYLILTTKMPNDSVFAYKRTQVNNTSSHHVSLCTCIYTRIISTCNVSPNMRISNPSRSWGRNWSL